MDLSPSRSVQTKTVTELNGNDMILERLRNALNTLLDLEKSAGYNNEEDTERFFAYLYPAYIPAAARMISQLAAYLDVFSIIVMCDTANGNATIVITEDQEATSGWSCTVQENEGLNFPESGEKLCVKDFKKVLLDERKAKASVKIKIQVTLEKASFLRKLAWPADVSVILFIASNKLMELIKGEDCSGLHELLTPNFQKTIVLLLADRTSFAKGPNLFIFGRDTWTSIQVGEISGSSVHRANIENAIQFRENECQWEVGAICLTPFHLHIETNQLDDAEIVRIFANQRDRLCVGYIANRLRIRDNMLVCDFFGHKHVQVHLNPADDKPASTALFNLFQWAYDNASSDKIGVLRQIISLQLTEKPGKNYDLLLENANVILISAKSNFQFFLRRSVELYFDKRLKVSEFLHKFSNDIGKSISDMASELISNLYKTVGVVLGVMIATLVDPPKTPVIVHWTSLLYFIYIVFILLLLLPSYYLRFRGSVLEFDHNKSELKDVLLEEEIERIEGDTFSRTRLEFLVAFSIVNLGYAALAAIALVLFWLS